MAVHIAYVVDQNFADGAVVSAISALKNNQVRIVGSMHCPDDDRISYSYIDNNQVGYQGAVIYNLFAVNEDKSIEGPFTLGTAIVGTGV